MKYYRKLWIGGRETGGVSFHVNEEHTLAGRPGGKETPPKEKVLDAGAGDNLRAVEADGVPTLDAVAREGVATHAGDGLGGGGGGAYRGARGGAERRWPPPGRSERACAGAEGDLRSGDDGGPRPARERPSGGRRRRAAAVHESDSAAVLPLEEVLREAVPAPAYQPLAPAAVENKRAFVVDLLPGPRHQLRHSLCGMPEQAAGHSCRCPPEFGELAFAGELVGPARHLP